LVPATQAVQVMSDVRLQAADLYAPALQPALHVEQAPALVVLEYEVPDEHGVHTVLDDTVQAADTYVPAGQTLHVAGAVTPDRQ